MNKKAFASVIIPTWNGLDLLKQCLPSILKQTFQDIEVIIIDNGSIDGSGDFVKDNYPQFKYIKLSKNLGFAAAVNLGIKKALGEYIVLINNDTVLDTKCIQYLVQTTKNHPEVGFVAAKMLQMNNPKVLDNAGIEIDIAGHPLTRGFGKKECVKFNRPGYVFLVSGGGSLFKKEVFERVGLFDDNFFAYLEDMDLCFRAQLVGIKGWYEPKAVIYHIGNATSAKNPAFRNYLIFRNMTMLIIKNLPLSVFFKQFNWLKILLIHLNTIRFLALNGHLWQALQAEVYILSHLGQLLQKRHRIQKSKIVSDQYIAQHIQEKKIKAGK